MSTAPQLRVTFNAALSDRTRDPVSDPEPPAPPLPEPDPGVFHHEPGQSPVPPHTPTRSEPSKDRA